MVGHYLIQSPTLVTIIIIIILIIIIQLVAPRFFTGLGCPVWQLSAGHVDDSDYLPYNSHDYGTDPRHLLHSTSREQVSATLRSTLSLWYSGTLVPRTPITELNRADRRSEDSHNLDSQRNCSTFCPTRVYCGILVTIFCFLTSTSLDIDPV